MPLVSVEYVFQYLHFNYILRIHILLREQLSLPIRIGFRIGFDAYSSVFCEVGEFYSDLKKTAHSRSFYMQR